MTVVQTVQKCEMKKTLVKTDNSKWHTFSLKSNITSKKIVSDYSLCEFIFYLPY